MKCHLCQTNKLRREFPDKSLTDNCDHAALKSKIKDFFGTEPQKQRLLYKEKELKVCWQFISESELLVINFNLDVDSNN